MGALFDAIKAETKIVEVIIVASDSRKSAASSVGRGLVGGALFGGIGLIAGAVSAKNKNETTFRITYASGRQEIKTCKNGSSEYKKYIKMI